jgi:SAM-dependent methyltransferase
MTSLKGHAWHAGRRLVDWSAARLDLATYTPEHEYREQLGLHTEYREDARPIRDKRPTTQAGEIADLTLTVDGLQDVTRDRGWEGKRVLEVGPKYGVHSLWIDEQLRPSELVFSDFAEDRRLHDPWVSRLRAPHRWVYGDLREAEELAALEPFDVVFFLGVLYHSAFHLPLLQRLNQVTRPGGEMLLETTVDPRPDASLRVRWQAGVGKAKMIPTVDAVRIELAWTGWRDVTRFTDYRPGSSEALFLCRKTDELDERGLAEVVSPHRVEPPAG